MVLILIPQDFVNLSAIRKSLALFYLTSFFRFLIVHNLFSNHKLTKKSTKNYLPAHCDKEESEEGRKRKSGYKKSKYLCRIDTFNDWQSL